VSRTLVCAGCGSKIAATRERCPRCLAHVVRIDPQVEAARSRRLASIAAAVLGTAVLAVAIVWLKADRQPEAAPVTTPSDPLASRRQAGAPAPPPDAPAARSDERAFIDSSAAAAVAYDTGDYGAALSRFEDAVRRNPRDAESLSNLGQVLVRLGRAEDALPYFERACALNPDRWAYRFNLARALSVLGRWEPSIASYRQAQQLFPDDYVTTFNLALALHKSNDEPAAVEEYQKAIALNPADASFRMALGISYEALQRRQEAAEAYGEYLRLAPSAPDADKVRSRIALLTGQPAPAGGAPPAAPAGTQ
jgi:tetratricopeptide (TPR) repeat protein